MKIIDNSQRLQLLPSVKTLGQKFIFFLFKKDFETVCRKKKKFKRKSQRDSPGGPVVKNPPSSAGDVGSIPGLGTKIPCAAGQLSPSSATTEPARSGAHVPQQRAHEPQLRHDVAK